MLRILRTAPALEDLDAIWDFIAIEMHNLQAANDLLDEINDIVRLIALQPGIGTAVDELVPGCRRMVLRGKYLIYFRTTTDGIEILRVLSSLQHIHKGYFET